MKIHEYQAKQLFREFGVPVPEGVVCRSADEAAAAFDTLGGPVAVVKSQIHAGGRGKGRFKQEPDQAGVVLVRSADEARDNAARMLGNTLVTKQTGDDGQSVKTLYVEGGLDIAHELYLAVVVDREAGLPVIIASREGGMEIEEVAEENPDAIIREHFDPAIGLQPYEARKIAYALGLDTIGGLDDGGNKTLMKSAGKFLAAFCKFFVASDCSMAEVNPLVVTKDGRMVALDGKVTFDDNALYRHKSFGDLVDMDEENAAEMRAAEAGLSYVDLDGNIGCLVNGAGLAMSTMDIIKLHGGEPANFLDVGGGADVDAVTEAFRIILDDPNVKAVLVNIFGGIMNCATIAEALIAAYDNVGINVPLVVRLEGNNVEAAREMLAASGKSFIKAADLTDAAQKVVATLSA